MRISALMGLMILSVMAGCGDSDDKDEDKDDGANNGGNNSSNSEDEEFDAGMLPGINNDDLDDCDKGDPCCINSDQFDFVRCNTPPDGGTPEE